MYTSQVEKQKLVVGKKRNGRPPKHQISWPTTVDIHIQDETA